MIGGVDPFVYLETNVAKLALATALGMFLGLEREWSQKSAGIRTFALVSLAAAVFSLVDEPGLLVVGGVLVVASAVLLAVRSFVEAEVDGLSLTTSASLLVTYGVGVLVAEELFIESVTVAVLSSLLLVLKRELHQFAWGLSREEVRSAVEFTILAFVVFPLLPAETIDPWNAVQPRLVWSLVVAVSAIGFVNYVLVKRYQGRGYAVTGFFGGLVNSTAVVAEMAKRAKGRADLGEIAVGSILLANAAMAFRNAAVVAFFVPEAALVVGAPLGAITVAGIGVAVWRSDWRTTMEAELTSPFSLGNALTFGALFLLVLLASAVAERTFGAGGFVATSFLAGLVSSGTSTTTAVSLLGTGQIGVDTAVAGVVAGTAASILVKTAFAASIARELVRPVFLWNLLLIAVGVVAGAPLLLL
ncbi:MgtC/SapB family protein [Halorubrum ezzemoulense]|uniref:MgtC/SapB family protein n=1 Tax=Halorubrum ezzemoulense TaxID=337243 RepID=UPI00232BE206|nr:MgtC/SapB family protein [Halorubrum ezzemoulense]MDB9279458.1 MgtC/SapB family protein [Halorubrum ezzemoulense]MDB9282980.1 MgtC/SapB family protein [Halorubrum ezzemoulense]